MWTPAFLFVETLTCPPSLIQKLHQHCLYPGTAYSSPFPLHAVQPFASDGKIIVHNSAHSEGVREVPPSPTYNTRIHSTCAPLFMWCPQLECASKVPFLGCHAGKSCKLSLYPAQSSCYHRAVLHTLSNCV